MKSLKHSSEYYKEREKILHSYFTDLIEVLSDTYSPNDISQLFNSLSFPIEEIIKDSEKLSFDSYLSLIKQISSKLHMPGLGLKLGTIKSVKNFGIYGYALMSSTTYEQFNAVATKIFDAIYEPLLIKERIVDDMLEISYLPKTVLDREMHITLMEQVFTCGISLMDTQLPEEANWKNCILNCDYPAPKYATLYNNYFSGTINFNQPVMQMCVPADWMGLALKTGNHFIYSLCDSKIKDILSSLNAKDTLSNQVRHILLTTNFNNLPTAREIANIFHMGERTLHLHLSKEDTSYRALLNEVRNELAHRYLNESDLTIKEIAFLLGYEHSQNFYRAFVKNNLITPTEFRKINR